MHLRIRGAGIPEALCETVASITDHARLRHPEIRHDDASGEVRLPITRFPLIKQRRALGNLHDRHSPIQATVTVRNVVSFDIEDNTNPEPGHEIVLLFGIRLQDKEVYACSAEEDRGQHSFSVTLRVAELDVEIADEPNAFKEDGA